MVFQEVSLGKENKLKGKFGLKTLSYRTARINTKKLKADFNEYLMLLKKEDLVISTLLLGPENLVFYTPLSF